MQVVGGRGAGEHTELGYVGWLVGCAGDAQSEEFDSLVLGISDSRKNVRVPRVGDTIREQNGHFDASGVGLLQVDLSHVGDGVGGVGAVSNVDDGIYAGLEVLLASPVSEGLLCDNVTAVLQQSRPEAQAAAGLQLYPLESVHHVHDKLLLLLVIVLGTLRAVQQEGELQAAVLIYDGCVHTEQDEGLSIGTTVCFTSVIIFTARSPELNVRVLHFCNPQRRSNLHMCLDGFLQL